MRAAGVRRRAAGVFVAHTAALLGVLSAARAGATCVTPAPAPGLYQNIQLTDREGDPRRYDLYVPSMYTTLSNSGDKPVPLVVDLHGLSAGKTDQRLVSGFKAKADSLGFVVVYPNGKDQNPNDPTDDMQRSWNAYNCCGPAYNGGGGGYDDVGFLRDLVADVAAKVNIDHQRIYITGISNGGDMTHRLACEAADLFAAAAAFSFDLALPDTNQGIAACTPSRPISITIFRGYREGNLAITSYCPSTIWDPPFPGAQAGLAAWAQVDGCAGAPLETAWSPSSTQVACFTDSINNVTQTYATCNAGVHVKLTSWDAGHVTIYALTDGADKAWDDTLSLSTLPGLPDADADSVSDIDDNCPTVYNPNQLDSDNDCRGDACPLIGTLTPTPTATATPTATPTAGCPDLPPNNCFGAGKSSVSLKDNPDISKRKFSWKWSKGAVALVQAAFGDPVNGTTAYRLCVYDQSAGAAVLTMGVRVAAGGMCGGQPCWKAVGDRGWRYRAKDGNSDGITKGSLMGGDAGKPRVQMQGKGTRVPLPAPFSATRFFHQDPAVIVQLHGSSPANCWSSTFDAQSTRKNDGAQFKATTP